MMKSSCLRTAIAVSVMSLSCSLQAQTAAVTTGGGTTATTAIGFGAATAPGSAGIDGIAGIGFNTPMNNGGRINIAPQISPVRAAEQDLDVRQLTERRPQVRPLVPSQFQRFVQESTGRLLPMYGRELFDAPQAYAANANLPVPDNYLLGPGDEISLHVWGPVDFNSSLTIDRNGQVNVPKVGVITLAGVAARDLETTLRAQLGKVFTNFNANATLGRLRGIQVYVVGQAQQPGTFQLSSLSTLVNALFASGGPNTNGSMRNIELKRAGKTISTLDLYDFIARGDKSRDLALMSGDIIVIPSVGPRVAITGAFDQAAIFELKPANTTVGDILTLGGGVPALATTQKALLERINRDSTPPRQVQDLMLNENGLRMPLRDGDVLTLLGISPAFANAVTLQGTVAAPLRYRWFEGMTILDLIPDREALITGDYYKRKNLLVQGTPAEFETGSTVATRIKGIADQINWDYALIERLNRKTLLTEIIPFNLGRVVLQRDAGQNLTLQSGDVVTILSQTDLRVPQARQTRLIRIEGEVAAAGIYQAAPGETLRQLLTRIGGLTPQAYIFGAEFNRESVRKRQQENLEQLTRRLEAQAQAQSVKANANRTSDSSAQVQATQMQQQAQLRSQIERLKSAKSNGRMALELDPKAQTLASLPDITLEDGDRILIPSVPSFISAFGAVNNENVFIYKPGKTVEDIFKSAGLTEEAEPSQAFVLRADGSIIGRRDRKGLFGNTFESLQLMPGDTVVVPSQIDPESGYSFAIRSMKDVTQILANFGLGIAAFKSIKTL